jgi:hypothetical protein
MHCSEYQQPRPADATHRVIEAVRFELERPDDDGTSRVGALIVWLTRDGQTQNRSDIWNGRLRPPKTRTIAISPEWTHPLPRPTRLMSGWHFAHG